MAGHRCELCGEVVVPWADLAYARVGAGAPTRVLRGAQRCTQCGRVGCPSCLRLVEEQVDDFFILQLACHQCLSRAVPSSG